MDIKRELMTLWTGKCTVFVKEIETDKETGRVTQNEKILYEDLPCHLTYYYYLHHAKQAGPTSSVYQRAALFVDRDTEFPFGSKIRVTQNGKCADYALSGVPVVYSSHREIPVSLSERWI